jgi:adenylylsulfate kinase
MSAGENIHPIFDQILQREDKEKLLGQRACVIWMTGLSGSGKSTIAKGLEKALHERGYLTKLLDGDNVRTGINKNLGFSEEDRAETIRRIAEVSRLFLDCGVITVNSFVSPTYAMRDLARQIIGPDDFVEVYVKASYELCEQRDVKGLYAKAKAGQIAHFTGKDAPFDEPLNPEVLIDTESQSPEQSVAFLLDQVLARIEKTSA